MTGRTVFKIFGSLGPGGSVVTLMEKLCKRIFNEAYELGDPTEFKTKEEDEIKNARQDYVNDLFNYKSTYERKSTSLDQADQEEAKERVTTIL
jgi:hypothetical protein